MTLAVVDDPTFDAHQPPSPHPERPERLAAARRAANRVAPPGRRIEIAARAATDDELARVHEHQYVEHLGRTAGRWHTWDEDTYGSPRSVDAARKAAGGALDLVGELMRRGSGEGVALLRPPGHHAGPEGAMGFCLLNNVALAAAHAKTLGAGRVLVVDFDVHHGNGTQDVFFADPSVLFVSLHQFPFYPGTGSVDEVGSGEGRGFNLNVPLSAGADDAVYAHAFSRIVLPAAESFAPDVVLISAGFDAHRNDPLGGMRLTAAGYGFMTGALRRTLPRPPMAMLLEGGYDLDALEASLGAAIEGLVDPTTPTAEPFSDPGPAHAADLRRAEEAAGRFWPLG
jgi:acetoin utilization deacetylase AcuC-like enzyme